MKSSFFLRQFENIYLREMERTGTGIGSLHFAIGSHRGVDVDNGVCGAFFCGLQGILVFLVLSAHTYVNVELASWCSVCLGIILVIIFASLTFLFHILAHCLIRRKRHTC